MASYPQPGETFGPYLIVDRLGQGGMGAVFRATQTTLNRQVALKVLLPHHAAVDEFRERFSREAGLLATVDSPHIVTIYDFGEYNGCMFIATQLVAGGDLAGYLNRHGALSLPLALTITQQLAAALSAAHQANVVHRDVKPTNVLLGERDGQPHAVLCDFGIARAGSEGLTQTGTVVGTYAYLAPERIDGADATPGTDIYALGCLLVALLSGHAPYQGTDMQVAQQHLSSPIPQWEPTSPVLARLNHIVRTSMAKDPRARYASAQDMRQDLLHAISESSAPAPAPPPPAPGAPTALRNTPIPTSAIAPPRRERKSPVVVAAATVAVTVLVAAIGVGAFLLTRSDDTNDSSALPRTSSRTPAAGSTTSGNPTGSGATRRCIDGRSVPAAAECGEPQGIPGLEAVFPTMPPTVACRRTTLADLSAAQRRVMTASRQCERVLPGGRKVVVTYSAYRDYPTAANYLGRLYQSSAVHTVGGGVVQYDNFRALPNGGSEVVRIYDAASGHPFSVSVACGSDVTKCTDTIDAVQFLPLSSFDS